LNINKENNYAFIDSQNLHLAIKNLGWKLDSKKFRVYLKDKYFVNNAYLFIGYIIQAESSHPNSHSQLFFV